MENVDNLHNFSRRTRSLTDMPAGDLAWMPVLLEFEGHVEICMQLSERVEVCREADREGRQGARRKSEKKSDNGSFHPRRIMVRCGRHRAPAARVYPRPAPSSNGFSASSDRHQTAFAGGHPSAADARQRWCVAPPRKKTTCRHSSKLHLCAPAITLRERSFCGAGRTRGASSSPS